MEKLTLITPGNELFNVESNLSAEFDNANLAFFTSGLLNIFFYIAGFLLLFWLVWGVFQYLLAGGNKEGLTNAKKRIRLALIGFLIVVLSFAISQYAQTLLNKAPGYLNFNKVTPITTPAPIPLP